MQTPSIFNDVIGPVMRGPSSSHTAASVRIARVAAELLGSVPVKVLYEFDPKGALATTYDGQGSDMGLAGGFMGYTTDDDRLPDALKNARERGMQIDMSVVSYPNNHPNTYKMTLWNESGEELHVTAISTGGGIFEIIEIEKNKVSVFGDYYELYLFVNNWSDKQLTDVKNLCDAKNMDEVQWSSQDGSFGIVNVKSVKPFDDDFVADISKLIDVVRVKKSSPVLPVRSRKDGKVPFLTAAEMDEYARKNSLNHIWELAVAYEAERGGISEDKVFQMMKCIVERIKASVERGFDGTEYKDRILDCQMNKFSKAERTGKLFPSALINSVVKYTISMMEVKSSMGVIVAAPTAGACAVLPGAILGTATKLGKSIDECTKAMLAAGIIGVLIAYNATFSAEVGGCQAECGSGSGMAAAGIVELMGGDYKEGMAASSMALQNIMGMVCDPVANRVEVPCMGKNVMGAVNAISSATMALAGVDSVIPLDEVISTLSTVGHMIPFELRCTGYGGLSITPTARKIEKRLAHS